MKKLRELGLFWHGAEKVGSRGRILTTCAKLKGGCKEDEAKFLLATVPEAMGTNGKRRGSPWVSVNTFCL